MGAMIRETLATYPASFEAACIAVLFFALFGAIGGMVFRAKAKPVFDRAGRLPLDEEEK